MYTSRLMQIVCTRRIAFGALKVALVVGTLLNAINQSGKFLADDPISWLHVLLNYFVPYCVASYSAARNDMERQDR